MLKVINCRRIRSIVLASAWFLWMLSVSLAQEERLFSGNDVHRCPWTCRRSFEYVPQAYLLYSSIAGVQRSIQIQKKILEMLGPTGTNLLSALHSSNSRRFVFQRCFQVEKIWN